MPTSFSQYPLSSESDLKALYVGKNLRDVPLPAAVIDVAIAKRNCDLMLEAAEKLEVGWRAHVKTHKTIQLTRLQVGSMSESVKLIVSTVAEAENLIPYLLECTQDGRSINVLYGLPLPLSQAERLGIVAAELGPGSISLMIDDADQLPALEVFKTEAGFPPQIFIKIDTGYHRAGIPTDSLDDSSSKSPSALEILLHQLAPLVANGTATLLGFYSHSGHAYQASSSIDVMQLLIEELQRSQPVLDIAKAIFPYHRFILSVGSTPTTTSVQNILFPSIYAFSENQVAREMKHRIDEFKQYGDLELHAGVYPLLDEQQLATHARRPHEADNPAQSLLSHKDIALTILTEVCSVYNHRKHPEALIAAGSLALGREPCPSYRGWGVVSNWGMGLGTDEDMNNQLEPSGLIVERVSQEHGILAREDRERNQQPLEVRVGQRVRIFPNHSCIAGVGYGWYVVVDSSMEDKDEIVDVWVRWRGW